MKDIFWWFAFASFKYYAHSLISKKNRIRIEIFAMNETHILFLNDKKRSKILSFLSIEKMSEQNIHKRWEYLMSISMLVE